MIVTKAREAKTWADSAFLEPGAQLSRPGSTCDPVRFEESAQVDDAQLQEFAFSGNVSLTRRVAVASRRELP